MAHESVSVLATEVMKRAQSSLLVHLRFMNTAFSLLKLTPLPDASSDDLPLDASHTPAYQTNGREIRFCASAVLKAYQHDEAAPTRAYLHMVLHNVFLHLYPDREVDARLWNLACDIAVESVIDEINLAVAHTSAARNEHVYLETLRAQVPLMSAEYIYRHLRERVSSGALDEAMLSQMENVFVVDDHTRWYTQFTNQSAAQTGEAHESDETSSAPAERAAKDGTDVDMPDEARNAKPTHKAMRGMHDEDITTKDAPENMRRAIAERLADTVQLDRSRDTWKNAAYEMGVALDTYIQMWGLDGSALSMNLREVTRERRDYREFLRKFARMGEQIRVNDDEFDYVFYTFGLRRYGNLPLIEPLEFVEEKRIKDFVIVIDTSASTKDGLVRRFIEKTYEILSNETSFFAHMNVLIIQADAEVADATYIHSLTDLERYIETLEIRGIGGTDFRPAFEYVAHEIDEGRLEHVGGLLYFTDGHGTYPRHRPDFESAFVLVQDNPAVKIPPWAMRIVLEETQLLEE